MTEDNRKDPWLGEAKESTNNGGDDISMNNKNKIELDLLERLTLGLLKEQRRTRRWGIFFKLLLVAYLFIILIAYMPGEFDTGGMAKQHTALVEIRGVIADDSEANADNIISGIREAFENTHSAGIILRINSPGGSPVQAGYVNDEIKRLREKYPDKPVYAVVTDICASGGYYIAAAANEIFVDKASIVGSIGVLMDGFGFVGSMEKLGVERRLLTAGENKGFLDPFSPLKEDDMEHARSLLKSIHGQFINIVKEGRGNKLKLDNKKLFSGLVWTGEQSIELGLADAVGSSSYVAREVIGAEKIVNYTRRPPYFERFAERFGVAMAKALTSMSGGFSGLK